MQAFLPRSWRGGLTTLLSACLLLALPTFAAAKQEPAPKHTLPAELQAIDPQVQALLEAARSDADLGKYQDAFSKEEQALKLAQAKGFVGDVALAEATVGSAYFAFGRLDDAFAALRQALQGAIDSANLVLEADVLVSLSVLPQSRGDLPAAADLLTKALDRANESKNLYIESRVLGELGRVQLLRGERNEGRKSIENALKIDTLNNYELRPLHLVYHAYATAAESHPEPQKVITEFKTARDAAIEANSYLPLGVAESALALTYIHEGKPEAGVAILEDLENGIVRREGKPLKIPGVSQAIVGPPFVRATYLEALATGYGAAKQPAKALGAWNELYSFSKTVGLTLTEAEAAQKLASLYGEEKDADHALSFYSIASQKWRAVGNDRQLIQTLVSEALLLMHSGRGEQAKAVEEEIGRLAAKTNNRPLEFTAHVAIAGICHQNGDGEGETTALEGAQSLISPGPSDSEIDNKLVLAVYLGLADAYHDRGVAAKEVAALEKAFVVARALKDETLEVTLATRTKQKLEEIRADELTERLYKSGRLADALTYSQLIYVFKGAPPKGQTATYWTFILNIPFQLIKQPGGATALTDNLAYVGPLLGIAKLPILQALAGYYLSAGNKPQLARGFALEAVSLASSGGKGAGLLGIIPVCELAMAYARTNELQLALQNVKQCSELAKSDSDPQTRNYANVANVIVHVLANDLGGAQESLRYLAENAPTNAALHEELAGALGKNGRFQEARSEFKVALEIYERQKDNASVANTYIAMATTLDSDNSEESKREEFADLQAAMKIYQKTQDIPKEATAALAIARYYAKLDKKREALDYAERGLALAQKVGQEQLTGVALSALGDLYSVENDLQRAVELHRKAVAAFQIAKDAAGEASALMALGWDLQRMNRLEDALGSYFQAEAAADRGNSPITKYFVLGGIASLYEQQGQFDEAETALRTAERLAKDTRDATRLARSYLALAGLHEVVGDWEDAADEASKALRIFQNTGDRDGQADAISELVTVYSDRASSVKNFDKALEYYAEGQKLRPGNVAESDLLEVYIQTGKYSEAAAIANQRIRVCRKTEDIVCEAHGLLSFAEAERLRGDLVAAAAAFRRAKPLAEKSGDLYLRGRLLYGEANLARAAGKFDNAAALYEQVIALIEQTKSTVHPKSELAISETYDFVYDELIDSLYWLSQEQAGRDKLATTIAALDYTEKNKARQFAKSWGEAFVREMKRKLPVAVLAREQELISRRYQLAGELQASISGHPISNQGVDQIQKELATAEENLKTFVGSLRREYPTYAALEYPEAVSLTNFPLQRGETLAEFKMTDRGTFVWLVRNKAGEGNSLVAFYKVSHKRDWFDHRVLALRDAFNSGRPDDYDPRTSEQLFDALFPGVHAVEILNCDRIIWIPDGTLYLIPFEMLSPHATQGSYPLLSVPTKYYPSAGALRVARTAIHPATWKEAFFGAGDPVTSPNDDRYNLARMLSQSGPNAPQPGPTSISSSPENQISRLKARGFEFQRLPGTAIELREIAHLFSERHQTADVLLGIDATKRDVLDTDLSKFQYIHFATHGILPVDAGVKEPSLVLSYDGTAPDRMLFPVSTILKLRIYADSVVLSACNTGSGNVSRAEGVMSLGRAFMAAGASSVTVSLWQVSDKSTALLMEEYYRELLAGKSKDVALADARVSLFGKEKRYSNPFYWAPFILIGE